MLDKDGITGHNFLQMLSPANVEWGWYLGIGHMCIPLIFHWLFNLNPVMYSENASESRLYLLLSRSFLQLCMNQYAILWNCCFPPKLDSYGWVLYGGHSSELKHWGTQSISKYYHFPSLLRSQSHGQQQTTSFCWSIWFDWLIWFNGRAECKKSKS